MPCCWQKGVKSKQREVPSKSVVTCKKRVAPLHCCGGRWIGRTGEQSKIVEIIVKDGFAGQIVDKQTIQPDQWLWPASQCNELFTIRKSKSQLQSTIHNLQSTIHNPQFAIHISQFNPLSCSQPPPSLSSSAWWQPWATPPPSSTALFSSTTPNGFQRNKSFATVPVLHQKFASTMASMAL